MIQHRSAGVLSQIEREKAVSKQQRGGRSAYEMLYRPKNESEPNKHNVPYELDWNFYANDGATMWTWRMLFSSQTKAPRGKGTRNYFFMLVYTESNIFL